MRVWTAEARAAQSALMKRLKPWTKSTGPRTPEGKAKAEKNSFKTGLYARARKENLKFLQDCKAFFLYMKTEYYKSPASYRNRKTDYYKDARINDRSSAAARYNRPYGVHPPPLYACDALQ